MSENLYRTEEHLVTENTNVGELKFIDVRRKNRPAGLRKPYEYVLPSVDVAAMEKELRDALKDASHRNGFGCAFVERKGLSRGVKLSFFVIAFRPGLCGGPPSALGVTPGQWEEVARRTQDVLRKYLGPDAVPYTDPYAEDKKFQSRWTAYIMYEELAK